MLKENIKDNENINPNSRDIEKLKSNFPHFFDKTGEFLFDKFKEMINQSEITINKESYELKFLGKSYARYQSSTKTETFLSPHTEENNKEENKDSENLYIIGDNIDALKHLLGSYAGKIKCIYIDPPYNTGNDGFVYLDNFTYDEKKLSEMLGIDEEEAKRIINLKGKSSHSAWLTFMYPRLILARELLSEDGVIFISIDDNEQANLKLMCDEILGEDNFYGELIQLKGNTQNDSKSIQKNHEYILCYSKTNADLLLTYSNDVKKEVFEDNYYLGRDTGASSGNDTLIARNNLGYTIYYYEGTENGATGNNNTLIARNNLGYGDFKVFEKNGKIYHAIALADYDVSKLKSDSKEEEIYTNDEYLISLGYSIIRPPKRTGDILGRWTWGIENFRKLWNNGEVLIKNNKNVIKKEFVNENDIQIINNKKYYIKRNILPIKSVLNIPSNSGTREVADLFNNKVFDNPKTINLISELIKYSMNENDIILDFFSGSATTAHAVMQLNAENNVFGGGY